MRSLEIKVPYQPPDEYSLTVVAERKTQPKKGRGAFGLGLTQQGHPFLVLFDWGGNKTRLSGIGVAHSGVVFKQGRSRTIVCTCRRDSLIVAVDGQKVIEWNGDYKTLGSETTESSNEYGLELYPRMAISLSARSSFRFVGDGRKSSLVFQTKLLPQPLEPAFVKLLPVRVDFEPPLLPRFSVRDS